ncbi:MAG: PEGA domain-containing protein [Methanolinea sp.]|nr:PEGA domain-containing protein [Methanolinea sp.]
METRTLFGLGVFVVLACILAVPATATTVTVISAAIPAAGASVNVSVVADYFPDGLSGYIMNASVSDPAVAEITGVSFPAWAGLSAHSPLPAAEVSLRTSDLSLGVSAGARNVTLVSLTVRGKAAGSTVLTLSVRQMDPDGPGSPITPTIVPGTITVGGTPTTVPTTTPATTVTTAPPTTVPTTTVPTTALPTTVPTTIPATTVTTTPPTTVPTTTPATTVTTASPTTVPPQEPAYITVFSYPLGGSVSIDGTSVGTTPLQDYPVAPGTHTLTATYPGYRDYTTVVTLAPGEHKSLPLIIFTRSMPVVTTFPTGIPTATATATRTATATATATLTATSPTPTPTGTAGTGALKVTTFPSGTAIFLDSQPRGTTPATITGIPAGDHELRLVKQGYKTSVRTVRIEAGKTTVLPFIVLAPEKFFF